MKKFTIQIIFLVIIIFFALGIATSKISTDLPFLPKTQREETVSIIIGNAQVLVEIANTKDKRTRGLGGREVLASNSGMLFVFPQEDKYRFWMKGLKFPLDIIWIKNNMVVDIIKGVAPPMQEQKDETLPIYIPRETVDMVLEVNSGFVDANKIKTGDTLKIP